MWNIFWKLFLEIMVLKMRWKSLGRFLGVPSLFRNFLGIFLCMEMCFSPLCVQCSGVLSVLPFDCAADARGQAGGAWLLVQFCKLGLSYAVDSPPLS